MLRKIRLAWAKTSSLQYLTRSKWTANSIHPNNRTRYLLFLGASATASLCFLLGQTVHADASLKDNTRVSGGIQFIRKHGLKRVDSIGIARYVRPPFLC